MQKSDIIHCFRKRNTKRRKMVLRYYQALFDEPYTADVLAQKISDDLDILVDRNFIYQIRADQRRQQKGRKARTGVSPIPNSPSLQIHIPDLEKAKAKLASLLTF